MAIIYGIKSNKYESGDLRCDSSTWLCLQYNTEEEKEALVTHFENNTQHRDYTGIIIPPKLGHNSKNIEVYIKVEGLATMSMDPNLTVEIVQDELLKTLGKQFTFISYDAYARAMLSLAYISQVKIDRRVDEHERGISLPYRVGDITASYLGGCGLFGIAVDEVRKEKPKTGSAASSVKERTIDCVIC